MRIRGMGRLRLAAQHFRNKFVPGGLILLYHRITELPSDPQLLAVTQKHFSEHLEILRKFAHPMSLQQMTQALQDGDVPHRAVVITFDDGYADNLYSAKSVLEQYEVPGTVFVTTGDIGTRNEFWWDELDRILLRPGTLPDTLHLSISGHIHHWALETVANYSEEAYQYHRGWHVLKQNDPSPRQSIYRALSQLLRPLAPDERQKVLDDLLVWATAESHGRPTHRVLSPEELSHLAENGLVEIGAHTVTHSELSALPADRQRFEVRQSKARLEEILGSPIESFSYPYGSQAAYTAETVDIVRDARFTCACSNFVGLARPDTDFFQLPRVLVRDWDGDEFARQLEVWFRG